MVDILDEVPPSAMRDKWGWFVGLGILLLICGGIALGNLFIATVASVYYVGMLMLIGGIVHLAHAFQVRSWEHILFWVLSGLLYTVAGILAFANPLLASEALTLFLAIALLIAGTFRVWVGRKLKPERGWIWIVISGLATAVAGIAIAVGWPANSLWILGLFLAFDLIFQGWTVVVFGLVLRR
ncbi:HdeD family acid-resistance protein [Rhizobium sp. IMFF44]|uniref:HdeD family acid-resistance protein n=1 Tax=unclassified Rhizobium TaxID=2613769 RepID=UPI0035B6B3DF